MANDNKTVDIFSQEISSVRTYKLGKTIITIPGFEDSLVCQSANFAYGQAVTPIIPLNRTYKYLIVGDATGTGGLSVLIGPSDKVKAFIKKFSNACKADSDNTITLESSSACGDDNKTKFTLRGVIITQVGTTIARGQGADIMIANVQFMFNGCTM